MRHALRPHTTIVMAESGFAFPFDLNHLSILKYEHLGKDIGYTEVVRVRKTLKDRIVALLEKTETDSPVFLFLPELLGQEGAAAPAPAAMAAPQDDHSLAELMKTFQQAKRDAKDPADWLLAIAVLNRLLKLQPADPYIVQQLALATYKSQQPDAKSALEKARTILETLSPETSCDPETVGLWGSIHKRLWDVDKSAAHLDRSVRAYARGYFIKSDYYNGINFAFLLNLRASTEQGDEVTADRVFARRIRREVLDICDAALAPGNTLNPDDVFWATATKVEAFAGLGRMQEAEALKAELVKHDPPPAAWMVKTMEDQLARLEALNP